MSLNICLYYYGKIYFQKTWRGVCVGKERYYLEIVALPRISVDASRLRRNKDLR